MSERQMRKEMAERSNDLQFHVGIENLQKTKTGAPEKVPYAKIQSIKFNIESYLAKQISLGNFIEDEHFKDVLYLKLGADKGGTSTKLCYQIVNLEKCNSAEKTQIICLYEGTDTDSNMRVMFGDYREEVEALSSVNFRGNRTIGVKLYLLGYYKFLCAALGHMGQNALYPCINCLIPLKDLKREQLSNPIIHSPKREGAGGLLGDNPRYLYQRRSREHYKEMFHSVSNTPFFLVVSKTLIK
jgi:hypothetical protein